MQNRKARSWSYSMKKDVVSKENDLKAWNKIDKMQNTKGEKLEPLRKERRCKYKRKEVEAIKQRYKILKTMGTKLKALNKRDKILNQKKRSWSQETKDARFWIQKKRSWSH